MREGATRFASLNWSAAVWSGLIGGAVFLALEMILVPALLGGSMWGPPRMIAAIALGPRVLPSPPPPPTFDAGVVGAAMILHFALSIVFATVLALGVSRIETGPAIGVGFAFGLVLYFVNFYGFTAVFPWFAQARNGVTLFTHLVFGGSAAAIYKAQQHARTDVRAAA